MVPRNRQGLISEGMVFSAYVIFTKPLGKTNVQMFSVVQMPNTLINALENGM